MTGTTAKPCACCDGQAIKRRHESAADYTARRTCSRSCGQSLRRGKVKKTVETTQRLAALKLETLMQVWPISKIDAGRANP